MEQPPAVRARGLRARFGAHGRAGRSRATGAIRRADGPPPAQVIGPPPGMIRVRVQRRSNVNYDAEALPSAGHQPVDRHRQDRRKHRRRRAGRFRIDRRRHRQPRGLDRGRAGDRRRRTSVPAARSAAGNLHGRQRRLPPGRTHDLRPADVLRRPPRDRHRAGCRDAHAGRHVRGPGQAAGRRGADGSAAIALSRRTPRSPPAAWAFRPTTCKPER